MRRTATIPDEPRGLDDRMRAAVAALAVAAIGAVGSVALAGIAHVTPMYFVVFVAGVIAGPVLGLGIGGVALALSALLVGRLDIHTVTATIGMAEVGGLAGLLARLRFRAAARTRPLPASLVAAACGAACVVVFSLATDTTEWLVSGAGVLPGVHAPALGGLVVAGLAFNLPAVLVNAALFGAATVPTLRALERIAGSRFGRPVVGPLLSRGDAAPWRPAG